MLITPGSTPFTKYIDVFLDEKPMTLISQADDGGDWLVRYVGERDTDGIVHIKTAEDGLPMTEVLRGKVRFGWKKDAPDWIRDPKERIRVVQILTHVEGGVR